MSVCCLIWGWKITRRSWWWEQGRRWSLRQLQLLKTCRRCVNVNQICENLWFCTYLFSQIWLKTTDTSKVYLCRSFFYCKQPIRTRYLGHVTGYQPIRDQYFLMPTPRWWTTLRWTRRSCWRSQRGQRTWPKWPIGSLNTSLRRSFMTSGRERNSLYSILITLSSVITSISITLHTEQQVQIQLPISAHYTPPQCNGFLLKPKLECPRWSDHKSCAERGEELMRPGLHEFLAIAYAEYDIVIWCKLCVPPFFCLLPSDNPFLVWHTT